MKRSLYMAGTVALALGFPQSPLSAADRAPATVLPHLDLNSQASQARDAVSLQGLVVDGDDRGVSTAVIYAVSHPEPHSPSRSAKRARAIADESGHFVFSDLPPGRYVLVAIHGHHSPGHSDPVVVGQFGMPVPVRIRLGERPPEA